MYVLYLCTFCIFPPIVPGTIVKFPPPESIAELGSRYQLDCEAAGQPEPIITWRIRGSPVNDLGLSSVTDLGNGSLVFNPVNKSHEGTYVCSIESPSFLVQTTVLSVQDPSTASTLIVCVCVCVALSLCFCVCISMPLF